MANCHLSWWVKWDSLVLVASLLTSCSSLSSITESQLSSGYYDFHQRDGSFVKVYVKSQDDSISIFPIAGNGNGSPFAAAHNQLFRKPSFDIDVLIVPFKYRPSSYNFPSQLTTEFNGNIFLGYRMDRYKIHDDQTPGGRVRKVRHHALSVGGFAGIGTTFISPWTTNYRTTDEYNGFILSHGLSAMVGIKSITVGVGIGWDYLTDRDKDIWIYQNSPWYGLTLSLNLN